jgi:maltooligosyltrehalose trehalohydrolase
MSRQVLRRPFGAVPLAERVVEFGVWAPSVSRVEVRTGGADHALEPRGDGSFAGVVPALAGDDYLYVLDGGDALPDPCSRSQPEGVRGPSRGLDTSAFEIAAGPGLPLEELVL